jgi:hypothetical protein
MLKKDFEKMSDFLDHDVKLISPLAEVNGRENVVFSAKNFGLMLKNIEIESKF